jgi:hypothetical protein
MNESERTTAVGVFEDRHHAQVAIDELCRKGFSMDQIGFVMHEGRTKLEPLQIEQGNKAGEGAATGAATGGTIGGFVGAALATSIIPGIGPVIAGGLLVGIAAGAVAGLAGGGLFGTLVGLSIPEEEAKGFEKEFHSGRTVVTVHAGDRYAEATEILRRVSEDPEAIKLRPGERAARISESSGPETGGGNVFPGEW